MFCVSLRVRMNSAMLRTWKVVGGAEAHMAALAEQRLDLALRVAHLFGGSDLDHDALEIVGHGLLGAEQAAPTRSRPALARCRPGRCRSPTGPSAQAARSQ